MIIYQSSVEDGNYPLPKSEPIKALDRSHERRSQILSILVSLVSSGYACFSSYQCIIKFLVSTILLSTKQVYELVIFRFKRDFAKRRGEVINKYICDSDI